VQQALEWWGIGIEVIPTDPSGLARVIFDAAEAERLAGGRFRELHERLRDLGSGRTPRRSTESCSWSTRARKRWVTTRSERYSCWGSQPDQSGLWQRGTGAVEGCPSPQSNPDKSRKLVVDTTDPLNLRLSSFIVPVPITQMAVVGDVLHTSAGPGGYAAFRIPGLTSGQYAAGSCSAPATWTLNPPGVGNITSDGVYTAPAGISAQQTVTVTAVNPSDPTQTASSTVTLWPGLLTTLAAITPPRTRSGVP